jgi:hypothetical protein
MQNYFPSLNAALESESLVDVWPLGANLNYGDTIGLAVNGRWISIYRDETGRYERPVHYATQMADTGIIHLS